MIAIPADARRREPIRSDAHPAIGDRTAIANGIYEQDQTGVQDRIAQYLLHIVREHESDAEVRRVVEQGGEVRSGENRFPVTMERSSMADRPFLLLHDHKREQCDSCQHDEADDPHRIPAILLAQRQRDQERCQADREQQHAGYVQLFLPTYLPRVLEKCQAISITTTPMGMLIRKIERQPAIPVSRPPSAGPRDRPM